jgi:proteasome accessory factor B
VVTRTAVQFDHRRSGAAEAVQRTLEPWGIVSWHGRWYVVGRDRDRQATRMFRLSRIGATRTVGEPGAFTVPPGTDLRALVSELAPSPPTSEAKVRARAGSCVSLRRRATAIEPSDEPGWDLLHVPYADAGVLAEEVASYGPDAVVDAPGELLDGVLRRLRAVAGI